MSRLGTIGVVVIAGSLILLWTIAAEPPGQNRAGRILPAELLAGDGVISEAIPPDYERPLTYLDESRIRSSKTSIIWPEQPILPDRHRLSVQVAHPSRLARTLQSLDVLRDDDLAELALMDIVLDQASLKSLKRFTHVENLGCRVRNDQDVSAITETWPELQCLTINEVSEAAKFTDNGLIALSKLQKLRALRVFGTQLTGAGFRSLADMPSLEGIDFAGNQTVRGPDISPLSKLPRLRELVLRVPADFTDTDLMAMTECKNLLHICIFGAQEVSQQAVARMRTALPRCVVHVRPQVAIPKYDDLR